MAQSRRKEFAPCYRRIVSSGSALVSAVLWPSLRWRATRLLWPPQNRRRALTRQNTFHSRRQQARRLPRDDRSEFAAVAGEQSGASDDEERAECKCILQAASKSRSSPEALHKRDFCCRQHRRCCCAINQLNFYGGIQSQSSPSDGSLSSVVLSPTQLLASRIARRGSAYQNAPQRLHRQRKKTK